MARKKRNPAVTTALENAEGVERPVEPFDREAPLSEGADPESGGQAGDLQGLSDVPQAASESVRELAEEGQFFEAALLDAVENAPPADAAEVTAREVPEDDVPLEYLQEDPDVPKE